MGRPASASVSSHVVTNLRICIRRKLTVASVGRRVSTLCAVADESFGPWAPLTLGEVRELLATCPAPWWITGGHALELHLGRTWRAHDDIDVGIRRCDAEEVLGHLITRGWEPVVAAAGTLSTWGGGPLSAAEHQNNVWCRRPGGDWQLDVTVGDGDDAAWV